MPHPTDSPRAARDRHQAAARRLRAARCRFALSTAALREAARDHVDGARLAGAALRATLDRLAARAAPSP